MKKVIFFDGVCNLCHGMVKLLIRIDKKDIFYFASLQSQYAQEMLLHANGEYIKLDTVVYQKEKQIFTQSDAILEIFCDLGGLWKAFSLFRILPKSWRNKLYQLVATRRYRWFGRKDRWMLPTEVPQQRFLD